MVHFQWRWGGVAPHYYHQHMCLMQLELCCCVLTRQLHLPR